MGIARIQSVAQYMAAQPASTRRLLAEVRKAIRAALPEAEEIISYQIPAYRLGGRTILYFAGWANHFSLYPAGAAIAAEFADELEAYEVSRGTIRFPIEKGVPVKLIRRIVQYRAKEALAASEAKQRKGKQKARASAKTTRTVRGAKSRKE